MPSKYDPFAAQIEPLDPMGEVELLPRALKRSMMWDMVGDDMIRRPEDFGETMASQDVIEREYKDMLTRRRSLLPFGHQIDMAAAMAAVCATDAILTLEEEELDPDEKMEYLAENIKVSAIVTKTVISHMIAKGLIHYGGH